MTPQLWLWLGFGLFVLAMPALGTATAKLRENQVESRLEPTMKLRSMKWRTVMGAGIGVMIGLALGVCAYTFIYAKGASYLTNDPKACINCHVMQEQYDGWIKSSHRSVAACNDGHTPSGLLPKYATKAQNGFWHSFLPRSSSATCARGWASS